MYKGFFFSVFVILLQFQVLSQEQRYFGVIKVDGAEDRPISYMLQFDIEEDRMAGYSLTDLLGTHETKNRISGIFDSSTGEVRFSEKEILYTVSPVSDNSFCFINFEGKLSRAKKDRAKIQGSFKGLYPDGKECARGTLELIGDAVIEDLIDKANKRIQRSKKLPDSLKNEYDVSNLYDSTYVHQLGAGGNVNVFSAANRINFEIWDGSNEDGDLINLYRGDELILKEFTVRKRKHVLEVDLPEDLNVFRIEALNQGDQGLNTVMIDIQGNMRVQFRSNLKKGEISKVSILKEK